MILIFIICAILYLIMVYGVISLYYTYRKDYEEIDNRILQLEKQINIEDKKNNTNEEGDTMTCGRRGRPRGSHNTTHGGRKK